MTDAHFNPDLLRPVEYIDSPDPRNESFVIEDASGWIRALRLEDLHQGVASIVLSRDVPIPIHEQFETAKNLFVHAWFVYRFFPIAEQQCYSCLEFALRTRLQELDQLRVLKKHPALHHLFNHAIRQGMFAEIDLSRVVEGSADENAAPDWQREYLKTLGEVIPKLRNTYAHGGSTLHAGTTHTFRLVAALINYLYSPRSPQKA